MKSLFVAIIIAIASELYAQPVDSMEIAGVYDGKKWREIDRIGEYIHQEIEAYDRCWNDSIMLFQRGGRYGFMDAGGREIITPRYTRATCFMGRYASVEVDGKWGVINGTGRMIIPPQFDFVGPFTDEGIAGFLVDGRLGTIDTAGTIISKPRYFWFSSITVFPGYPIFQHGLIAVVDGKRGDYGAVEGKLGFMNLRGELVIPAIYDMPGMIGSALFFDGVVSVNRDSLSVLVDTNGQEVFTTRFETNSGLRFDHGFAEIIGPTGYRGLINRKGEVVLEPKYNGVNQFSEGFAAVQIRGDEHGVVSGFIDTSGRFVFGRTFGFVYDFSEGRAAVEIGNKWGYIDTTGRLVIPAKFAGTSYFINGLASVTVKRGKTYRHGFIRPDGTWAIEPRFEDADAFAYGVAPAKSGGLYGYINERGEWVIKPRFVNAHPFRRIARRR